MKYLLFVIYTVYKISFLQVPSLEQRLKNVNLDDADQLWSALTTTERQEFEALIQSGEASKLLPSWSPWWLYSSKKKLVKDITKQDEEPAYKNSCPKMLDTPALESLTVSIFKKKYFLTLLTFILKISESITFYKV